MKRNFLTGFLSGIIGAIFLFAAVGVTYIAFNDDTGKQNKGRENVSTAQDNENNTDREESYDEIVEKLMVLEEVIDTYYLDEVDRMHCHRYIQRFISSWTIHILCTIQRLNMQMLK